MSKARTQPASWLSQDSRLIRVAGERARACHGAPRGTPSPRSKAQVDFANRNTLPAIHLRGRNPNNPESSQALQVALHFQAGVASGSFE